MTSRTFAARITVAMTFLVLIGLMAAGCGGTAGPTPPTATTAAPAPAPAATGPVVLSVKGAVDKPLELSMDALKAIGVTKLEAEHPKKGKQSYEGVLLSALLTQAQPKAGAAAVVFTAKDAYKAEVRLADISACKDCLVAIDSTTGVSMVMPKMDSGTWVRDVITMEVK